MATFDDSLIEEGEIVYDNILELIRMYPSAGEKYLRHMLEREIIKYGRDNVLKSLAQAPYEATSYAEEILFYEESSEKISRAIAEFADMITGLIPDEERAKALGEVMDRL